MRGPLEAHPSLLLSLVGPLVTELILALGQKPWPEGLVPVCAERTSQKRATETYFWKELPVGVRKGSGTIKSQRGLNNPSFLGSTLD